MNAFKNATAIRIPPRYVLAKLFCGKLLSLSSTAIGKTVRRTLKSIPIVAVALSGSKTSSQYLVNTVGVQL